VIVSYTHLDSTEVDPRDLARRDVPLLPRDSGEVAWIWEEEARGRIGMEVAYTGAQRLEHDPYRTESPSYVEVNVLAELRFGETGLYVNALDLTDVRQTDHDPLLLPARAADGRWTTDVWAPLAGRTFNAGVRLEF